MNDLIRMSRRRRQIVLLAVFALVFSAFGLPAPTAGEQISLRLASQYPRPHFLAASTRFFEEEMQGLFKDRLTIKAFYGGTVMGPEETLDAIGRGTMDAGTGLWIYAPGRVPLGSFEYNFVFNDPNFRTQAKIKRELFETVPALREELERNGIARPLLFAPISAYQVMSKRPIKSLDDLRGLRIGFTPTEYVPVFSAAGAVPVLSPAPEFYERLDRGVVDAVSVSIEILNAFRIQQVAPHLLKLSLNTPTTLSLWVNLDYWNHLSEADRRLFIEAGKRAEDRYLKFLETAVESAWEAMRKAGVTVAEPAAADLQRWVGRMPNVPHEWAKKMEARGLPGWRVVEKYVELSERNGWKFPIHYGR